MIEKIINAWEEFVTWLTVVVTYLIEAIKDIGLFFLEGFLDALLAVVSLITPPDFLAAGLTALVASLDPSVTYLLGQTGFTEGLAMYSTAQTFRLYRKLFTLGIW